MTTPDAPHDHRSAGDRVATLIACALASLAVMVSLFFSPFFVMATDSCGHDNCRDPLVTWAYAVTWGGVAIAVVVAVVGMIRAIRRRTVMWIWPAIALALVVVTFVVGAQLASSAAPVN